MSSATDGGTDTVQQVFASAQELRASIGRELGPSDWLSIEQPRVNGFADVTGDHQWIHVDPERAADGPFGTTIAHGFLTLSLVPHFMAQLRRVENVTMGINYGLNKVRFPSPVPVGARVRARMTHDSVEDLPDGAVQVISTIVIEAEGAAKPACVAEMVVRTYFAG